MEGILTTVMDGLESAAKWVLALLPSSPFSAITNTPIMEFMTSFGWLIPVAEILSILEVWVSAIAVFYLYQAILRFTKMIE